LAMIMSSPTMPTAQKKALFTLASIALGIYAQLHKAHITAPVFDPILASCTGDDTVAGVELRPYEAAAGLGVFTPIVCTVTQFMYQLRDIYPGGYITWGLAVVGVLPLAVIATIEGGAAGAWGPIRYPICMGIVHQLLGMSVSLPLFWFPSYIWGRGDGPASAWRVFMSIPVSLPAIIFSIAVFTVNVDSFVWRLSAGVLGGPALALVSGYLLSYDTPPCEKSKDAVTEYFDASIATYRLVTKISLAGYAGIAYLAYISYGVDVSAMWRDIFTEANASVAFLTIDYILIQVSVIFGYVAYRSWFEAVRAAILLPIVGPAAVSMAMERIELASYTKHRTKMV